MPLHSMCPTCGQLLAVSQPQAGVVTCPQCGELVRLAAPPVPPPVPAQPPVQQSVFLAGALAGGVLALLVIPTALFFAWADSPGAEAPPTAPVVAPEPMHGPPPGASPAVTITIGEPYPPGNWNYLRPTSSGGDAPDSGSYESGSSGISSIVSAPGSAGAPKTVNVSGYTNKNGTVVGSYQRSPPSPGGGGHGKR